MESPRSPKRRRILSSINPPETRPEDDAPRISKRDRTMTPDTSAPRPADETAAKEAEDNTQGHDPTAPRSSKFRFKHKSSRSSRRRDDEEDDDRRRRRHRHRSRSRSRDRDRDKDRRDGSRERDKSTERRRRHRKHHDDNTTTTSHRHRHHHRRHRHHRSRTKSPAPPPPPPAPDQESPDPFQNNPFQEDPPLSPTTAFRESLFDAMADDEGAAYWESVYGQPIHIYEPPATTTAPPGHGVGGTLERMTDDEYAAYVRQKMWEKTHAGLLEARARREREREERAKEEEEKERVAREMERCLRRGEERRRKRGWRERWRGYGERWAGWEKEGGVEGIPWPEGAGAEGVEGETVRAFFVKGIGLEEVGEREFAARLKEERVRWHPDKMQQRLGGKVDEKVMRDVTAIFQVVDALWNDTRKSGG